MTLPGRLRLAATTLASVLLAAPVFGQTSGLEIPPQDKPTQLSPEKRGDLFMARKMFREAIDAYRQAMPQGRPFVLYNKIGIAYHHMLDFNAAKKNYDQALKLNPQYAEALNNIGALYFAQKNYRRAISEYQKALKVDPDSATIYSNLGTAFYARKRIEDAMKAYQHALALNPDVFETRGTAGTILQEKSGEEQAKLHYFMAKSYAQAGMPDRALQYMRRCLEEGFKDRKKFLEEPEFSGLKDLPEFKQLMAMEFRVL
jgi:tetratricopeptide (TPR) repeat protein